jgi:catechol 2,3-dioxygenase-like lactoylglutathione lyase family enzyme
MVKAPDLAKAHLRIARLSADLAAAVHFYREGLGFDVLYEFKDHDGFDAVMLGRNGCAYHLALVHKVGHRVEPAPTHDDLLVFYLPDSEDWTSGVTRLKVLGHQPVKAFNPYWDKQGQTFEDPDGYRVVLQHASWPA